MVIKLYIGADRLDMFKDEDVTLNSSIASISDITKNQTEYTKSFTVPASDINNQIFKHYYDANLDGGFDARVKVDGYIELDGMPFKTGKFRLNKVIIKSGKPSSYNINFWGDLVSLKDKLKKDTLSDLDLSVYDHAYNSDNVKLGLTSSLSSGVIKYHPFAKKQYYYNGSSSDNTNDETLANISYYGGADTGITWNDLRPSIKLIKLIEAIETDYNIVFSRDFFGRTEFDNLFFWMNIDSKRDIVSDELIIDFDSGDDTWLNLTTNIFSAHAENRPREWWRLYLTIYPSAGYENVEYTVIYYRQDDEDDTGYEETGRITKTGQFEWYNSLHAQGAGTDYDVYYTVKSNQEFKFTSRLKQERRDYWGSDGIWESYSSEQTIDSTFVISENLPNIKIIDFLSGLFKMFKLVVLPLEDGSIYINTLIDYYASGSLINITEFIDYENYEVARGDILNEINFKFQDPSTLLNIQFEKNTSIAYGNEETLIVDENNDPLDGETLEFTVPFEQIVYERLTDINDNSQTNFQYGAIIDESLEPANPKAHIFYDVQQEIGTKKLGFINDVGVKEDLGTFINLASHVDNFEEQTFAILFGRENSTWDGNAIEYNLYTNYHKEYIDSIFNKKRRNFKFSAKNVPLKFLLSLSLNDVVQIKSDYYRIDNYNLNLVTGNIELNLINSFDNTISGFYPSSTYLLADYNIQDLTISVVGSENFSTTKVDVGYGVTWIDVTSSGSIITFSLNEENIDYTPRDMDIEVTNNDTLQEFTVRISQLNKRITIDNNFITSDNNIVTADNN